MNKVDVEWDLLTAEGVTRKERFTSDDPVSELDGPVLAKGCDQVCIDCEAKLVAGVKPTHSLANHLWIGELPCVVRVASGRGKLVANAIMFATPIRKVYDTLPISRDELSEVLAFVFLGSAKPTDAEFVRTPMFVRRQRVKDALDWLKLNHRDYTALEISIANLNDLPEAGIPCGVDWKQTEEGESNLVPEAMNAWYRASGNSRVDFQ
ncbi:hypothetical protein DFH08DRAFT_919268 [Mycena albidolilacea]|uniref:DUF6570 domain-containing protein n=1 Tax=Mycena albidolilacea TaxID=1033008 RepID=A0AAD6YWZ0_9AGAR|nr:hypothetical protein DFH08DRAFT_919268 [Mycena albidolilacea]